MKHSHSALLLATGASILFGAPAWADPGELSQRIPVSDGGTLYVELDHGRVDVLAHDASEVRIEARARGLGASDVHFDVRTAGNDVVLTGSHEDWLEWMSTTPTIRVRAWVPRDYQVQVSTAVPPATTASTAGPSPTGNIGF